MFELKDATNIRNISVVEQAGGAVVEMTLADDPELENAEEYLSLSVRVEYGEYAVLDRIKKTALQRAREVIAHEINRLQLIENEYT